MVSTRPSRVKGQLKRGATKPSKPAPSTPASGIKKKIKVETKPAVKKVTNASKKAADKPASGSASKAASSSKEKPPKRVRVWWPPTKDKKKTQFSGAYWPATVLKKHDTEYEVRYDNGDVERVDKENVGPYTPPVDFGQEATTMSVGEFCEVFNNSKSDPAAWVARIVAIAGAKYEVQYPFHDAENELVKENIVRRARVWDRATKEWLIIKPYQKWKDGEVSSPSELALVKDKELKNIIKDGDKTPTETSKKRKSPTAAEPAPKPAKPAPKKVKKEAAEPEKEAGNDTTAKPAKKRKAEPQLATAAATEEAKPNSSPSPPANQHMQPIMLNPSMLANLPPGAQLVPVMLPPGSQPPGAPPAMMMVMPPHLPGFPACNTAKPHPSAAAPGPPNPTLLHPEASESDDKDKAKKAKKKDPNAPKRPTTAYLVFLARNRQKILDDHTSANGKSATEGLGLSELQRLLGSKWKECSDEERKVCEDEAEKDRLRYQTEMSTYVPAEADEHGKADSKDDDGKKPKRDPKAPRKPSTAYIFFCRDFRKNSVDHSKVTFTEATNMAAEAWRAADAETKARYETMAAADKERHAAEQASYVATQAAATATAQAAAAAAAAPPPSQPPSAAAPPAGSSAAAPAPHLVLPMVSGPATTVPIAAANRPPTMPHPTGARVSQPTLRPVLPSMLPPGAVPPGFQMFRFPPPPPGSRPPFPMFPFPPPGQDPETMDALANGLDMKKARVALQRHYTVDAYYLLLDAWREDSSRLQDAIRSWKQNVKAQQRPDWRAFMIGIFGIDKMSSLQKNAVTSTAAPSGGPAAAAEPSVDVEGEGQGEVEQAGEEVTEGEGEGGDK